MKTKKIILKSLFYTLIFLSGLVVLDISMSEDTHVDGDIFDDSNMPVPFFRVMSDVDTSRIDPAIQKIFHLTLDENIMKQLPANKLAPITTYICSFYNDICERIHYETPADDVQKFVHTIQIIYLITQIDHNLRLDEFAGLRSTVHSIRFYDNPDEHRGKAGKNNAYFNLPKFESNKELREVMVHEIWWHVLDLWVLQDTFSEKHTWFTEFGKLMFGLQDPSLQHYLIWRQDEHTKHNHSGAKEFGSIYAQMSPFEDFAEWVNLWINHHAAFQKLANNNQYMKQKYDYFKNIFWDRYIFDGLQAANLTHENSRAFDSTLYLQTITEL